MHDTDFDDLLDTRSSISTPDQSIPASVTGEPVTVAEITSRISPNLYEQISNGDDNNTLSAIKRATVYLSMIVARVGQVLALGNEADEQRTVGREAVVYWSIWELHLSIGAGKSGWSFRTMARDIVISTYGQFPDVADKASPEGSPAGAIANPIRRRYPSR